VTLAQGLQARGLRAVPAADRAGLRDRRFELGRIEGPLSGSHRLYVRRGVGILETLARLVVEVGDQRRSFVGRGERGLVDSVGGTEIEPKVIEREFLGLLAPALLERGLDFLTDGRV